MAKLKKEDVLHIARLARLYLSEEEIEIFTSQLSSILDYMEELNEVDTSDVETTFYSFITETPMREDEPVFQDGTEIALREAPARSKNFFKVPRVIK